jgi:hypothetical protein
MQCTGATPTTMCYVTQGIKMHIKKDRTAAMEIIVVNHPIQHMTKEKTLAENSAVEKAIGQPCNITHMRLQGFDCKRICALLRSCDKLLIFTSTYEKIKHLLHKDIPLLSKVQLVHSKQEGRGYELAELMPSA